MRRADRDQARLRVLEERHDARNHALVPLVEQLLHEGLKVGCPLGSLPGERCGEVRSVTLEVALDQVVHLPILDRCQRTPIS